MKKKTLTIAIALVLVVALAVGATWAYLTKTSNVVTNTFTAGTVLGGDSKLPLRSMTFSTMLMARTLSKVLMLRTMAHTAAMSPKSCSGCEPAEGSDCDG